MVDRDHCGRYRPQSAIRPIVGIEVQDVTSGRVWSRQEPGDGQFTLAADLENGIVPAGFELLQFLDVDGSTACCLTCKLLIENTPVPMDKVVFVLFVSDDGVCLSSSEQLTLTWISARG